MGKRGGLNRYLTLVLFLLNSVFLLSAPIIEISKSNSSGIIQPNTYDNGEQILYKIKVSNSAGTDLNNIKISVPLSSITSSVETGGTGVVFTNLINQIKGSGGGAATGSISLTGDFLATGVDIPVGGYVEYFVLGTVNPLINGPIVTTGTVTDTSGNTELATISNTLTRIPYTYTIVKSSPISYYEKDGVVSYKIKVTNTGSATIKNFSLVDNLPNELIGSTITATASAGGNVGSFLQSGNLNATGILIPSGGSVEYTINATVKPGVTGTIENKAQSTVRSQSEESNTVALTLANYDFTINKTTTSANYTPNQNLTYKVKITNNSSTVKITKMKLEDILSTITATSADGSTKQAFVSGTISTTATVSDSGNSSGTFNATGDLSVTDITILPNTYIEYTIVGKVRDDIVGPITNPVKVTDRNGVEKNTTLTINSVAPNLNLTKTANVSTYKPGDTITYTVTLENTGAGIASNYYVEDLLNGIVGNLANTGGPAATNSASSQLFNNWSILATFASGSTKSTSVIVNNGGSIANQNLQDIVTIFPGEKITYTITGITKNAAIGAIINKVDLKQGVTLITSKTATSNPASLANNASVVITKVPTETEYKPGDIITYTITVNNPTTSYMDNVQIKDLLSQITATQIDGTPGAAFESWDLSVLSSSGIGTVPGTEALLNQSGNLILTADIGANGTIVYQLKAKVKSTTVGTILDTVTGSGDNVPESGSGVKMSSPVLEVAKNVDSSEYTPGGTLTYTVDVDNPGDGTAVNVRVEDKLSAMQTLLIDGTTGTSYQSWKVTAKVYDISSGTPVLVTNPSDITNPGFTGTFIGNQSTNQTFLVTNAILGPNRRITYTIETVLNPKAKGKIKNEVKVNNDLVSDKGSITRASKISISKSGPVNYVSMPGTTILEYEVVVKNDASAGVALGVKVEDKITDITAQLLNDSGTISPFSSWIIEKPIIVGSETKSTIISNLSNVNLLDTVDISPGGSLTYKIKATLKTPTSSKIAYGAITNKATADTLSATATTGPKLPNLNVSKTSLTSNFTPGDKVKFKIVINNTGDGYANNAIVKDLINTTYFEEISISGVATGTGTTTGISGGIETDLNTTVDIAPGGKIEYTIEVKVKSGYSGNTVSNTVEIKDVQNNLTTTTSATINKQGGTGGNQIDFKKRSDTTTFSPGGTITYFIDVVNKLGSDREVRVEDFITDIKATYANNLSIDNTKDINNQQAFTNWTIYKGVNTSDPNSLLVSSPTNLNDTVTVPGNSTVTYKIVGTVNERVVSPQITNVARLYDKTNNLIGTTSIQHNIIPPGGGITRVVDKGRYVPGVDTLKYTITVDSTGPGYQNNISINELIKSIQVELIDGTFDNPFKDPVTGNYNFTVNKVLINNQPPGTAETFTVGIGDNLDLVGTVDVGPGQKLQYVIEGLVRKDAIGTINNNGLITEPYRYNLQNTKNVTPTKYEPGKEITYIVTLRNNSTGNAQDILVEDDFSSLSVLDSTGVLVTPVLTNITLDLANSTTTGYKADLGNPVITNGKLIAHPDIPTGGTVVYKIKAIVNEKAVGNITNIAYIDGDAVSNQLGPSTEKVGVKKELLNYYDKNGTIVITGGYTPGGYIEYKITLSNTGKGILNNGIFVDDLSGITTGYSDGTTGSAFDSWVITRVSSTGASTIPDINGNIVLDAATTIGINAQMDLHPGGEIVYKIKAKINEKAVGSIKNTASLNGLSSSLTSSMKSPTITHTKQAYEANGTTVKNTFLPGETVVYKMKVTNTGLGTSFLQNYQDIVANVTGEVAETPGSSATPTESVFESYNATFTTSGGNVTVVNNFNTTINLPASVTIAPGGYVEFVITGVLKKTLIGNFTNTSKYANDTKTKTISGVPTTLSVTKKLTKLNGAAFNVGDTYKPGDSVEYEISILNTGNSFSNNLTISDNTDTIVTSLTGDLTGKALENIVISSPTVVNTASNPVLTDIKPASGNSSTNLQAEADLAPKDKITYTISGNIVKSAIGIIPANIARIGGTNYSSDPINPKQPNIISKKELITPVDKIYGPGETIQYKITMENTGEGFGNDIKIIDEISKIKTTLLNGTLGQAFSSWTISSTITHSNSIYNGQTVLQNTLVNNTDINTEIDIAPSGKIEIIVNAVTSNLAVGEIINTAKLNNIDYPADPVNPRKATVEFVKLPLIEGTTTYAPGGTAGFRLALANTSNNAIAKDISLTDIISGIKVQGTNGNLVDAFPSGWSLTVVNVTDPLGISITGIGSSGDISNAKVTLGPGAIVIVKIQGITNTQAIGDIINTANATYSGQELGPKSVTLTPVQGIAKITKSVDGMNYQPGGKINYTITVKNEGIGYLTGVKIIDNLLDIDTTLAGGLIGKAIDSYEVKSTTKQSSNTVVTQDVSYDKGYKAIANIYPGDTITILIEAKINPKAVGDIANIAKIESNTGTPLGEATTTVTTVPPQVQIMKTVDKAVYGTNLSDRTLTYTITVGNTGSGWANNVLVEDLIKDIKANIGGNSEQAFASWTITAEKKSGSLGDPIFESSYPANQNLSAVVSIPSMSAIDFKIVGILKEDTTTDIKNKAKFTLGSTSKETPEVITKPKVLPLIITKKQDRIREPEGYTTNPVQYWVQDTIIYQITVENPGAAIEELTVTDNIQEIKVNGSGGSNIPAFINWKIISATGDDGTTPSTNPGIGVLQTQPSGANISVTSGLKAGETLTIMVEAKINEGNIETGLPQSVIKNTAEVEVGTGTEISNEVVLTPYPPFIETSKVITSIGGTPYVTGATYEPGQQVIYTIEVRNTEKGVADNVVIKDDILSVTTELAGGTIGQAFSSWTIVMDKSHAAKVTGTYPNNGNIDVLADIGPDQYVKFIITATIKTDAVGTISPNILEVNGGDDPTDPIPPKKPVAPELDKKIIEGATYNQGGVIKYEIKLSNPNEKLWINDVKVVDLISSITSTDLSGNIVSAFKPNWTVSKADLGKGSIFTSTYPLVNADINDTIDLAPKDVVTFTVTAIVKDNIVGEIVNKVSGSYLEGDTQKPLPDKTVSSLTTPGTVNITKTSVVPTYAPGDNIGFDIVVENTSTTNVANDVKLTDIITSIKAPQIGAPTLVQAFKDGWTISYQIVGDTVNTDATQLPTNGDINNVNLDIGKSTKIIVQIRGIAQERIYGTLSNTATFAYPEGEPDSGEAKATIEPKDPELTLAKIVNKPTYISEDEILYTIEIQNIGTGVAVGAELTDEIGLIETEFTGAVTTGIAFQSWTRESILVPPTSLLNSEITTGDTYSANLNIAPGDKIIVILKGILNKKAYGEVENIAILNYTDSKNTPIELTKNAVIISEQPNLVIKKTINKEIYEDKDTLVYNLILQNGGLAWGNDIAVVDEISEIRDELLNSPAFESWTIEVISSSNESYIQPSTMPANQNLNATVDIAPLSQVKFIITAILKENVSSQLVNKGYYKVTPNSPEIFSNEVVANPINGDISIVKEKIESSYTPGGMLTYNIKITNNANILAKDVIIGDNPNEISVETNLDMLIAPFVNWKIISVAGDKGSSATSIIPSIGGNSTTPVEVKINIKPKETITLQIQGAITLGDDTNGVPVGVLDNKATAKYKEQNIFDVESTPPGNANLNVSKNIKTLAGEPFIGQGYKSGDELVYEITIENTGTGVADNISIVDRLSLLKTELAGEILGAAFESWEIEITKTKNTTVITPSSLSGNSDIVLNADIDIGDKVTIIVTAKINSKAVGVIPKNIVKVNEIEGEAPVVNPEKGNLLFKKELVDGPNYTQGGTIKYKLTIINLSSTYINDVKLVDEISKIKAKNLQETEEYVFQSWSVTRSDNGTGTTYSQGAPLTSEDINTTIDISPKDTIEYLIEAVVKGDIVKDIINKGILTYVSPDGLTTLEEEVTSTPVPGDITIFKEATVATYLPNGEIGFNVVVSNVSLTSVANNVLVKDIITDILANKIGGGTAQAFKPGWTITSRLEGSDIENSDISNLLALTAGSNIDDVSVDLGKNTKVIIEIRGYAESNIYGQIRNTAYFNYPDGNQNGKYDPPIDSIPSDAIITKEVDKEIYVSGETLKYTITIENTGDSVLPSFILEDALGTIEAEISGSNTTGLAFTAWRREDINIPTTSALLSETVINSSQGTTYLAKFDIAPKDKIIVTLTADTGSNVFGKIKNIATGKYIGLQDGTPTEKIIEDNAISTGAIGTLQIEKFVNTEFYEPGQEIEYKLVIKNTGEGWVKNATVEDLLSEITTTLYGTDLLGAAFDLTNIAVNSTTTNSENSIVILETSPNFKAEIDIKNGTSIEFTIKIKVSNLAVSRINNTATIKIPKLDGEEPETLTSNLVKIDPLAPEITIDKAVDLVNFENENTLTYTVTIENIGKTNVNKVLGKDMLKDITAMDNTGALVYPFQSGIIITKEIIPQDSVIVTPQDTTEGVILDDLSLKPGGKIVYTIVAKIKDGIVGNIENTAVVQIPTQVPEGEPIIKEDTVSSNPVDPTIEVEKTVTTEIENDNGIINGELVTYTIKVKTDRPTFNVQVKDEISKIKTSNNEILFNLDSIRIISVQENSIDIPYIGTIDGTTSEIHISRINSEAVIVLQAKVNEDVILINQEQILNTVYVNYDQNNDGNYNLDNPVESFAIIIPKAPQLELIKTAVEDEILLGDDVEYTLEVKNVGVGTATNFSVIDNISKILAPSNSGGQIPVYTEWTVVGKTSENSFIGTLPEANNDINIIDAKIAQGDTLIYTIKAKTSLNINAEKIDNIAFIKIPGIKDQESKAEIKVKKPLVTIDKEAGVRETSIGKFVPYSLLITNNENQTIKSLYVKDTPPAGFKYVENSLQIVKNGEKVGTIKVDYIGDTIVIGPFDLQPREQIEVVYLTRVSLGVVRGVYKNTALVVNSGQKPVSNEDTASVDVVEDPLFETTTVIGKVFHDRDGDGIQDDSRATGIEVIQDIPENNYISNSTFYVINGIRKGIPDKSVPLAKGIKIKEILYGRMSEREELLKSKVEIYTGLKNISDVGDIRVVTDEGTDITLTKNNKVISNHKGLKAKGMVSQNIVIKREFLQRKTKNNKSNDINYLQKITIINTGLIEEGFPGARVANVEGLVIITDQYGRFHIPEVSDEKGKNYILKVDEASLPVGTIFTTENPKVQRVGKTMIKYNFGIVLPRTIYETKGDGSKILKVNIYPSILFYDNLTELKPVIYKNLFKQIMMKLGKKDQLLIELNRTNNQELDEKRKEVLLKALSEYLSKKQVEVVFVKNKGEGR